MKKIVPILSIVLILSLLLSMPFVSSAESSLNGQKLTFTKSLTTITASVSAGENKDFSFAFDINFGDLSKNKDHRAVSFQMDCGNGKGFLWRMYDSWQGTLYRLYFDVLLLNEDGNWWRIADGFGDSDQVQGNGTVHILFSRDIENHCFNFVVSDSATILNLTADWTKTVTGKGFPSYATAMNNIILASEDNYMDYTLDNFIWNTDGVQNMTQLPFGTSSGATVESAHTHILSDWVIVQNPTCVATGLKEKTCSFCSDKSTAILPATGQHDLIVCETTTPATCSSTGLEVVSCKNCTYETTRTLLKKDHTPADTYTVDLAPTLVSVGFESKHCSVCGERVVQTERLLEKLLPANESDEKETDAKQTESKGCGATLFSLLPLACLLILPFLKKKTGKQIFSLILCLVMIFPLVSIGTVAEEETDITKSYNFFNVLEHGVVNNSTELQTEQLQAVLDLCKEEGGTVYLPAGEYYTASLYVYSNTTIHLAKNCTLYASVNMEDYYEFEVPADVERFDDPYVIQWTVGTYYRASIFSAIQEENICIEGEGLTSIVHGRDSFNAGGEDGFRGASLVFFSSCKNITIRNYSSQRPGAFNFQLDNCDGIYVSGMELLGGHDGLHLHGSKNIRVHDTIIHTGDDCLSGLNMKGLYMTGCDLNTACNVFRMSGENMLIENTKIWGPGIYPHRLTVVIDKDNILPDSEGRHYTCDLLSYETSYTHPETTPSDLTFLNCEISEFSSLVGLADHNFHYYKPFGTFVMKNCTVTGIALTSEVANHSGGDAEFYFINTTLAYADENYSKPFITIKDAPNATKVFFED